MLRPCKGKKKALPEVPDGRDIRKCDLAIRITDADGLLLLLHESHHLRRCCCCWHARLHRPRRRGIHRHRRLRRHETRLLRLLRLLRGSFRLRHHNCNCGWAAQSKSETGPNSYGSEGNTSGKARDRCGLARNRSAACKRAAARSRGFLRMGCCSFAAANTSVRRSNCSEGWCCAAPTVGRCCWAHRCLPTADDRSSRGHAPVHSNRRPLAFGDRPWNEASFVQAGCLAGSNRSLAARDRGRWCCLALPTCANCCRGALSYSLPDHSWAG